MTQGAAAITIPLADYRRLLEAAEADDMIVTCEICGAWLDRDEAECATVEDFTGCWKAATGREQDSHLCRSYRAPEGVPTKPGEVLKRALLDLVRLCAVDGVGHLDLSMDGVVIDGEQRGSWRLKLEKLHARGEQVKDAKEG